MFRAIMKYVTLSNGKIELGTQNVREYDTSEEMIDVCQDEHMFAASFGKNVSLFGTYSRDRLPEIERTLQSDMIRTVQSSSDCTTLSGGQQQYVHLVRLLLSDCPIMLLDEPFSAMDKANRDLLQQKLLSLPNKTLLVITHDLSTEHLSMYDEVLILKDGNLCFAGNPKEAVSEIQKFL